MLLPVITTDDRVILCLLAGVLLPVSIPSERVSLSTRQRVADFGCLVELEKAVRGAFPEIGERLLFNIQLVPAPLLTSDQYCSGILCCLEC